MDTFGTISVDNNGKGCNVKKYDFLQFSAPNLFHAK